MEIINWRELTIGSDRKRMVKVVMQKQFDPQLSGS